MSRLLYRLGLSSFRRPWVAIGAWALILGVLGAIIGVNGVQFTSTMSVDGTPSQEVLDQLAEDFPDATGGQGSFVITAGGESVLEPERVEAILAVVDDVYANDRVVGSLEELQQPFIEQLDAATEQLAALPAEQQAEALAQLQQQMTEQLEAQLDEYGFAPLIVDGLPVSSVLVSADEQAALFQFQLDEQVQSIPAAEIEALVAAAQDHDGEEGLVVLPGESLEFPGIPLGIGEVVGLLIAATVLVLALGSLLAGALPLVTGVVAVGAGVGTAIAASGSEPITTFTLILAVMVGLAVGMDYSLFIVNRQRSLIRSEGLTAAEAAARAVGTAGSSVVFAGLTVIIALAGLAAVGVSMLATMALVAAGTVALAVLVALTLLPALLGLVGERIVSRRARAHGTDAERHHRVALAWVGFVDRRRWWVLVGVVGLLVLTAVPAAKMTLGMPTGATATAGTDARVSYDTIAESFGDGFNGPLVAIADSTTALDEEATAEIAAELTDIDGVRLAQAIGTSDDGRTAAFTVIPETGPGDAATTQLVQDLRALQPDGADGGLGVTGLTAIMIDLADVLGDVFPVYIAIIAILSMIILLLVFRSVLVPVLATGGFLLSILATLGLTTLVFQDGRLGALFGVEPGTPIVPMIPIMAVGILYGLAMDYQVFLSSTMRDRYLRGAHPREAVRDGFSVTSRVVVAAAIIMGSVFAGFVFADDPTISQVGFTFAFGVLIDAFLVRMTLIPAAFSILGHATWWLPRWLDRILPDLDVEGHKLEQSLPRPPQNQDERLATQHG